MGGTTAEIIHRGEKFLVQTQDNGPRAQAIETLVYRRGRLVHSRKASWQPLLGRPDFEARLQDLIASQHRDVCADIPAGRLDHVLFKG
ncbi:MAG: hypothetical protein FJY80_10590 [Candidatus Aminicenantes bacterium]|nr:hypothetical protein [Candidatus Aminicenantes bacterium]